MIVHINLFMPLLQKMPLTKEISKISLKQSSEENFNVTFGIALMHSSATKIEFYSEELQNFFCSTLQGKVQSFVSLSVCTSYTVI